MLTEKEELELKEIQKQLSELELLYEDLSEDDIRWEKVYSDKMSLVTRGLNLKLKEQNLYDEYTIDGIPFVGLKEEYYNEVEKK